MFGWLFGRKKDNQKALLDDDFDETKRYVILEKMKTFEENVGRHTDKFTEMEDKNRFLYNKVNELKNQNIYLNNKLKHIEEKLDTCIVLEPLPELKVNKKNNKFNKSAYL